MECYGILLAVGGSILIGGQSHICKGLAGFHYFRETCFQLFQVISLLEDIFSLIVQV